MLLVRCHLRAMGVVLGSVMLGLVVSPSRALGDGRLGRRLLADPPTQVAHYAAVTIGAGHRALAGGQMSRPPRAAASCRSRGVLLLTHTRTALVAMMAGLLVAGLSMFAARPGCARSSLVRRRGRRSAI